MATQEIDTSIVGNSEQPRGQGTLVVEGVKLPIGLEQGVPDNILAVHNRPGHVNSNGAGRGEVSCAASSKIFHQSQWMPFVPNDTSPGNHMGRAAGQPCV